MTVHQRKVRDITRVEVQESSPVPFGVIDDQAVAKLRRKKEAIAFCFRIIKAKIHAAIIQHPHSASLIARRVIKNNAVRWRTPFHRLPVHHRVWNGCAQREPDHSVLVHDGNSVSSDAFPGCLTPLPSGKDEHGDRQHRTREKAALPAFQPCCAVTQKSELPFPVPPLP